MGSIKQKTTKTTKTKVKYRKSKVKAVKDSKGRLHCGKCGAYMSK